MELINPAKKILLVSSGQPSLNPRLVKEADTLSDAGFNVTVLYAYWNDWGTELDRLLLPQKKWTAICIGGDPRQKPLLYFFSRLIYKLSMLIAKKKINTLFTEFAASRSAYFLVRAAKRHRADLYIGHNLGALPAAVKAAKKNDARCGFDAEDFHRQELSDDTASLHHRLAKYIEDKYLPLTDYASTSSPLIAAEYQRIYQRTFPVILNVFPRAPQLPKTGDDRQRPLRLFWFSQTIGPNRGLELIMEAIGTTGITMELHLLGKPVDGYRDELLQHGRDAGLKTENLFFYQPIPAAEIFGLARQFDIGLASETGFCLNNRSALSNKIFTYIQCGLAVVCSNTPAQKALLEQNPAVGKVYSNDAGLASIFTGYHHDRTLLEHSKDASFQAGQTTINWKAESAKLLKIVGDTLTV